MLLAAARNNSSWCEAMCRAHGFSGEISDVAWVNLKKSLTYYPNLVILSPTMSGSEVLDVLREAPLGPLFVKDSFANADLLPGNYRVLIEAEWIHRPAAVAAPAPVASRDGADQRWRRVTGADGLRTWEQAWTGGGDTSVNTFPETLLLDDDVVFLGGFSGDSLVAGAVLHLSHGVAGVTNVFGPPGESARTWAGLVSCAHEEAPGVDLVGYERDAELAAAEANGFAPLGPVRIWQQIAESQ
ncbi:hypothetical protein [Kitasatospora sp. NBC_01300]|uniref:hypothetical protein n=1 Tax=Kitasatospora sp. NBC_01300 TaxID=2903574 RepID=UPI00352C87E0|nr:hypothetical protein OG556_08780 [Kitasatospora sp. NBC_01300]